MGQKLSGSITLEPDVVAVVSEKKEEKELSYSSEEECAIGAIPIRRNPIPISAPDSPIVEVKKTKSFSSSSSPSIRKSRGSFTLRSALKGKKVWSLLFKKLV